MASFLNSELGQLAHQLTLSPKRLRVEQIAGLETVLSKIQADQTYPYDWVCFHITGFQKRGGESSSLIPGKVLFADLVTMAEHITRRANLPVSEFKEPYWTQEQVAEQLQVSTKTIRRWRRRGLLGIRAVFPDGINRLIFPLRGVERFRRQNAALVAKAASFRQLTASEREFIIRRARELVASRRLRLHETARILSAETGRAVETIRYTLRRYDHSHKAEAVFVAQDEPVLSQTQQAIWDAINKGQSTEIIAAGLGWSPGDVERELLEIRVRLWKRKPIEYVHNDLFDAPNADDLILAVPEPPGGTKPTNPPDASMSPYLRNLYETPLLTPEQEVDLFRRYNYVKFKAARLLSKVTPSTATPSQVDEIAALLDAAADYRRRIIQANLRLVVSIARKHVGWSDGFFEVVSDGNMSLMRAVEKYDYARGFRFSTYATWAVIKNYARTIPEERYYASRYITGQDERLASEADTCEAAPLGSDLSQVRELIRSGLTALSAREREVVTEHYGLFKSEGQPVTLEELGRRYGVTKERVRQIEKRAMAKLRELLPPGLAGALANT